MSLQLLLTKTVNRCLYITSNYGNYPLGIAKAMKYTKSYLTLNLVTKA